MAANPVTKLPPNTYCETTPPITATPKILAPSTMYLIFSSLMNSARQTQAILSPLDP